MSLTLRRTVIAGQYLTNDYCVYDAGLAVGRIMLHQSTPMGPQWAWHINPPVAIPRWGNGRAVTLDQAKDEFRIAWERFKPTLGDDERAELLERQETVDSRFSR